MQKLESFSGLLILITIQMLLQNSDREWNNTNHHLMTGFQLFAEGLPDTPKYAHFKSMSSFNSLNRLYCIIGQVKFILSLLLLQTTKVRSYPPREQTGRIHVRNVRWPWKLKSTWLVGNARRVFIRSVSSRNSSEGWSMTSWKTCISAVRWKLAEKKSHLISGCLTPLTFWILIYLLYGPIFSLSTVFLLSFFNLRCTFIQCS